MAHNQMNQEHRATVDRISSSAVRSIWVTFQLEGIHCYPAAATDPQLNTNDEYNVAFLANPHRHMFHFRVSITVQHSDREIEFIQFKRWLLSLYAGQGAILNLNHKSCEMIADDLYLAIAEKYPDRDVQIEVSEDGENGCLIEYNQTRPYQSIKI